MVTYLMFDKADRWTATECISIISMGWFLLACDDDDDDGQFPSPHV